MLLDNEQKRFSVCWRPSNGGLPSLYEIKENHVGLTNSCPPAHACCSTLGTVSPATVMFARVVFKNFFEELEYELLGRFCKENCDMK